MLQRKKTFSPLGLFRHLSVPFLSKGFFLPSLVFLLIQLPLFSLNRSQGNGWQEEFWTGVDFFQAGQYQQAMASLGGALEAAVPHQPEVSQADSVHLATAANLYSLALLRLGRLEEGLQALEAFYRRGMLGGEGLLNYGLAALRQGDYDAACGLALESAVIPPANADSHAWVGRCYYVAALACFGLREWARSETYLEESRVGNPAAFHENFYHQYYLGLARFRQNKLEEAFHVLQDLYRAQRFHPLATSVARLAIHCALQLHHRNPASGWWEHAAGLSRNLVDYATSPQEVQERVLLAAGIYRDGGRHQEALALLEPYLNRQDEPSLACRFLAAEILASWGKAEHSKGNLEDSLQKLGRAAAEYGRLGELGGSSVSDTASYRQGEILYSMGRYGEAAESFSFYRRNYPAGRHREAALYFNGEALNKEGLQDQAILLHETLLARHPDSSFAFSSLVALVDLYRLKGEYEVAKEKARALQLRFPLQSHDVDIGGQLEELALLEDGMEPGTVELLSRYKAAGEHHTVDGRRLALELAARYRSSSLSEPAETLLMQVLESLEGDLPKVDAQENPGIQVSGGGEGTGSVAALVARWDQMSEGRIAGEEAVAAGAFYLLADLYRQVERCHDSARLFLLSARLYLLAQNRSCGGDYDYGEAAAAALYRGAESLDVAGLGADSQAVASQLETLFPQSRWTEAARIFL